VTKGTQQNKNIVKLQSHEKGEGLEERGGNVVELFGSAPLLRKNVRDDVLWGKKSPRKWK